MPRPPPARTTVWFCGNLGGRAGRSHEDDLLARFQQRTQPAAAAHFQHDQRDQPAFAIDPGPRQCDPFHRQLDALDLLRERFVILQAIELAGMEIAGGQRRPHHHLDDLMRQAEGIDHLGDELFVQRFGEHDPVAFALRLLLGFLLSEVVLRRHAAISGWPSLAEAIALTTLPA